LLCMKGKPPERANTSTGRDYADGLSADCADCADYLATPMGYPQIAQITQILTFPALRSRSGLAQQLGSPKTATASRPSRGRRIGWYQGPHRRHPAPVAPASSTLED
jgi:hypothetical protein